MPKKGEFSLLEKIDTEEDWLNLANKEVGQNVIFFFPLKMDFILTANFRETNIFHAMSKPKHRKSWPAISREKYKLFCQVKNIFQKV